MLAMPVRTGGRSIAEILGWWGGICLLKPTMIIPMVRASEKGPWQSMTTGMVNPIDMWQFRSSVCSVSRSSSFKDVCQITYRPF